jgi:hypothetical protein
VNNHCMGRATPPGDPPRAVAVPGGTRESRYELADDLVAAHGAPPSKGERAPISTLESGSITVWPAGEAPGPADRLGPVYRAGPDGPLAVPTGRVFVRFREGDRAEDRRDALAAAGYALESVPTFAPHVAWVRPASGRVADAVGALESLRELPGVEHVEPQLIAESHRRA